MRYVLEDGNPIKMSEATGFVDIQHRIIMDFIFTVQTTITSYSDFTFGGLLHRYMHLHLHCPDTGTARSESLGWKGMVAK